MKKITSIVLLVFILHFILSAQQRNLQNELNRVKPPVPVGSVSSNKVAAVSSATQINSPHIAQLFTLEEKSKSFYSSNFTNRSSGNLESYPDTIIVGVSPYDSLTITGTLVHNGPIFVLQNGVLIIKNATLTNVGSLYVVNNGKVTIDSSTLSFPQAYFYQLSLIVANKGNVSISNSTLGYGGFSHNCVVEDTAILTLTNVTQPDWMTTGMSQSATITINGTNQVGEIIIADRVNLTVKNATDCLLWHQFPDTSIINWSFGTGDTAYGYRFNNALAGVGGIEYSVYADSVYNVMWALMPSAGSNVNITNSKIRSIGLWFDRPSDSILVSGITDNATYSAFTAPLSDRSLAFSNCTVETWSFYVFNHSIINVTGCIAGEIGTENESKMYGSDYVVDGSGGYHWSADTSTISANGATVYSYVRSEGTSLFIFAYGSVSGPGLAEAIDNSLLIVVQSTLPADPTAINGGEAWFDNINVPGTLFADSVAPVNGSAWINRGPTSNWMYFKNRQLFYRSADSINLIPITGIDTLPVSNSLLADWNTHGLATGVYQLDLRLSDSWGNEVDAVRDVTLLPLILGINPLSDLTAFSIYPNSASNKLNISVTSPKNETIKVELDNMLGQPVLCENHNIYTGNNLLSLETNSLSAGIYICRIKSGNNTLQRIVVIAK